jgi:hypothetical protein
MEVIFFERDLHKIRDIGICLQMMQASLARLL